MLTLRLTVPTVSEPRLVRLVKPLTTFGRSADNDIVVTDPQVKPSHAYFSRSENEVTVVPVDGASSCPAVMRARKSCMSR